MTSTIHTVGLVPHRERTRAHELAAQAAKWLSDQGVSVRVPEDDAGPCGLEHLACPQSEFARGLDVVISLGARGESVIQPGSIEWFRAAAFDRAEREGFAVRVVPEVTGQGGWDPAAAYRTFREDMTRLIDRGIDERADDDR